MASKIEWTDGTWNPVIGCTKVSEGCTHCYAERMAARQVQMGYARHLKDPDGSEEAWIAYSGVISEFTGKWTGDIELRYDLLDKPLHWRKPRRIFVCSMSDLFHPKVPFEFIDKLFAVMYQCPRHIFQILTKRPVILQKYFVYAQKKWGTYNPYRNIWLGVTIENQDNMWRAYELFKTPAAVNFWSVEPMLGEIKFGHFIPDWIIVGGESGPKARPMHPDWVRSIRDQCVAANVPFFFKQWGEWLSGAVKYALGINTYQGYHPKRVTRIEDTTFFRVGKKKAGCLLDGREWKQYPERSDL